MGVYLDPTRTVSAQEDELVKDVEWVAGEGYLVVRKIAGTREAERVGRRVDAL